MLLRKLSSHFDSYNYCHKIIKVSFGKHNVGRCILSQSKGLSSKNFPGAFTPRPLQPSAHHIIFPRHAAHPGYQTLPKKKCLSWESLVPRVHAAAKCSRNSPNRALQVSASSKGPASTSCPGAQPRSRRPCPYGWVLGPKFSKQGSRFRQIFHKQGLRFVVLMSLVFGL